MTVIQIDVWQEHRTVVPRVTGSIPIVGIIHLILPVKHTKSFDTGY